MTYPKDYFQKPNKQQERRGIVAEIDTTWGTYTIYNRDGKVWVEAIGGGGAKKPMPQVVTVEEAKQYVWKQTKPLPQEDKISF